MISEVLPYILLGTGTGLSLIVAIGAQNAYILRQGIIGKFVWPIAIFCILSDALLIGLGVFGIGKIVDSAAWVLEVLRWGGGIFLICYGFMAAKRAIKPSAMTVTTGGDQGPQTVGKALLVAAAMTYLNPHAYLDAVVLLGGIANQQGEGRWYFYIGALIGSTIWFCLLAGFSRFLRPIFANPRAWRILDAGIAALMFFLAYKIMFG
ncbi:MAG: LysE/ArgO family amino acid transporter [Rothia sp. (in: high G+C Gram-positive bacteria)]|nr:LysE/ArgO family amino acid transporter [Rothia sp. (in: high G+C Gram-positive bacteria)]